MREFLCPAGAFPYLPGDKEHPAPGQESTGVKETRSVVCSWWHPESCHRVQVVSGPGGEDGQERGHVGDMGGRR